MRYFLILFSLLSSASVFADPIQVTVKNLKEVLIEREFSANASVIAANNSTISTEITANVLEIHVDIGDEVKIGDVLISLDAIDSELLLEQAIANLKAIAARKKQAEIRLSKAEELIQNNYISSDDFIARQTELAIQKAEYQRLLVSKKSAQRQLDKTQIKAPFDGVISERYVQKGQLMTLGSQALKLTQTSATEVHALIPANITGTLNKADLINFKNSSDIYNLQVIKVSPIINQNSGVQTVRLKFTQNSTAIGQSGKLVWTVKGSMLSADLLIKRNGQIGVFIAESNKARFKPMPQAQEGRPVSIDPELNWQIIMAGRDKLQDGDTISVK